MIRRRVRFLAGSGKSVEAGCCQEEGEERSAGKQKAGRVRGSREGRSRGSGDKPV